MSGQAQTTVLREAHRTLADRFAELANRDELSWLSVRLRECPSSGVRWAGGADQPELVLDLPVVWLSPLQIESLMELIDRNPSFGLLVPDPKLINAIPSFSARVPRAGAEQAAQLTAAVFAGVYGCPLFALLESELVTATQWQEQEAPR